MLPPVIEFIPGKAIQLSDVFLAQCRARDFWRRSDRGRWDYADGFDARANPVLPRHPREPGDRHTIRKSMSTPRRYPRQIIDRYNDHVFRQPIKRQQADDATPYGQFLTDADGCGTPLPTMMRRATRLAQVEGQAYLLADTNVSGIFQSLAQDQSATKRGIMRIVTPDQVVAWDDWEGQVYRAAIMFRDEDQRDFLWVVDQTTAQRIEIELTLAVESTAGSSGQRATMIRVMSVGQTMPHQYGGCPLVRMCPNWEADGTMGDDSQCAPLAESQRRLLNLESMLWEELAGSTFTMPIFIGVSPEDLKASIGSDLAVGPGMALCLPNDKAQFVKFGGDPAQAQSLRESIQNEIGELYRVAGLSPGNPLAAGAPESGVAKAFAFNEIEARLSALADAAEHAENLVVKRLSAGFSWADAPDPAEYPRSFDVPDLAGELDYTIRLVTAAGVPDVLRKKAWGNFASVSMTLSPDDQAELQAELDEQTEQRKSVEASPFVGGKPDDEDAKQ